MRKMTIGFASVALMLSATATFGGASGAESASAREVIAKVSEAARYLHDKGQAGFPDFNNNARWVWKDSYVFVFSCRDDKMIAHPLRPDLVGKPILQMEDDKGNRLFEKLCDVGKRTHGGWVEYWWPKPGEGKASRKISYTQRTQVSFQPDVRVGAGIYDDKTDAEALDELTQQVVAGTKAVP